MTIPNKFSLSGPFASHDLFQVYCLKYLEVPDMLRAAQVCKPWNRLFNELFNNQKLWKALFEREQIPLVQNTDGKERDYKKDFKILYPITIRVDIISQIFGKVTEKVPPISEEFFEQLKQPDPFEPGKLQLDNFVIVVFPAFISRTVDKETPLALDEKRNLVELSEKDSEQSHVVKTKLKIPLSLKNIQVLCSYPLKGKENMPVFDKDSEATIFSKCNDRNQFRNRPQKISLYLMRKDVVKFIEGYLDQEKPIQKEGFEVTPLRVRVFFDALNILLKGRCPDTSTPKIYSWHPEMVFSQKHDHVIVGAYKHGSGLMVRAKKQVKVGVGVVPSKVYPPLVPFASLLNKRKSHPTKPPG